MSLRSEYTQIHDECLIPWAQSLEGHIIEVIGSNLRYDRVTARAKSIDRFLTKASSVVSGRKRYDDPLLEIQDQLGARITVLYLSDVKKMRSLMLEHVRAVEFSDIEPQGHSEFGYIGWHAIMFLPSEIRPRHAPREQTQYFELQVKTLFQHAWAEAEHDLTYKELSGAIGDRQRRWIGYAAAQAWGADQAFENAIRMSPETVDEAIMRGST